MARKKKKKNKTTVSVDTKAEKILTDADVRLSHLYTETKDVIYRMSLPDGVYEYVSPASADIFGYTPEEFYNSPKLIRDAIHPDWHEYYIEQWQNLLAGNMPKFYEYQIIHKSGEVRWLHQSNVLVRDTDGNPAAIEGIVRDVTQLKQAEADKRRLEEQLRQAQKMEALGTLAGGIAHDFNNILAVIMGYTEISLTKYAEEERLVKNLRNVLKSAHRAKDMVQQILAFSRRSETTKKLLDMCDVVKEALTFLRSSIPTTIDIRWEIQEDSTPVMANSTQLHQVVINLCTNAAHAMKDGAGVLTVALKEVVLDADSAEMRHLTRGRYQRLTVSDTGVGMSRNMLARIFEPYFTTKNAGDGTGMGLAVVHGIVKNHGGDISVYSELGEGSTFTVLLPVMDISSNHKGDSEEEAEIPGGTERILLVDDEKELAAMTAEMLSDLGYSVTIRTGSEAALNFFKEDPEQIDLLVTDMTMPNLTGIELAEEIHKIKPGLPVILSTGFSDRFDQATLHRQGIGGLVFKPVTESEMARVIREVLENPTGS